MGELGGELRGELGIELRGDERSEMSSAFMVVDVVVCLISGSSDLSHDLGLVLRRQERPPYEIF